MRYRWPEGFNCAVVLSFDVDAESAHVFRDPEAAANRLDGLEERRYGPRVGVPRILRLLEKHAMPATFYVPGFTVEHHTAAIRQIQEAGYELACHGNVHETLSGLDQDAERRILQEQLDLFERHLGIHLRGYRSPSWGINNRTPRLLKEAGFVYDSSLMGDDIPYFLETPAGRLAEVPIQWLMDDAPFYRHVYGATNAIAEPDRVIRLWTQEFDALRRENGCFVLTMHPWISGRAGRLDGLEQLINHMRKTKGVWFATAMQVAEWALETGQNSEIDVSIPAGS